MGKAWGGGGAAEDPTEFTQALHWIGKAPASHHIVCHSSGRASLLTTPAVLSQLLSWREKPCTLLPPSLDTSARCPQISLAGASMELLGNGWVSPPLPFFHTRQKVQRETEAAVPIPGHPCTYCVWGSSAGICGTSQERERHICLSAPGRSSASLVPSTFAGPRAAATSQPPPALWPAPRALILPSDSLPLSALPDWGGWGGLLEAGWRIKPRTTGFVGGAFR